MTAGQRISSSDHASWREDRRLDIVGPTGKARIVGNGRIADGGTHTFPGIPGHWSTTDGGALVVAAVAEDNLKVNGHLVAGSMEVPTDSSLEFSDRRTGVVNGSMGDYSFVFFDPAALDASGISQIDYYPYNPAWVLQGELRSTEGRRIAVERLSNPRTPDVFPAPFDIAFTVGGSDYVLAGLEVSGGRRLVIFTDETSGTETPGIGRWLTLPATEPGQVTLDFNEVTLSYHTVNPNLFFCPTPPQGNHLPMRVNAGEHTLVVSAQATS